MFVDPSPACLNSSSHMNVSVLQRTVSVLWCFSGIRASYGSGAVLFSYHTVCVCVCVCVCVWCPAVALPCVSSMMLLSCV